MEQSHPITSDVRSRYFQLGIQISMLFIYMLLICGSGRAFADAAAEKKRKLMSAVRRIAIVAPIFGSENPSKATAPESDHKTDAKTPSEQEKRAAENATQLKKLIEHAATQLPTRTAVRTPFTVVSAEETTEALKALELTPLKLFTEGGLIRGNHFAAPDAAAVRRLAEKLHADAVILALLDQPRHSNGHYVFNPLSGLDYSSSHVELRGTLYVMMADGTEALHDVTSALHPITQIGTRTYLLVDCTEAEDLLIENWLDEWTCYTPEKH